VVPALLDLGYQLRLCLLNAACYGVPQIRHVSLSTCGRAVWDWQGAAVNGQAVCWRPLLPSAAMIAGGSSPSVWGVCMPAR
jgi:hypothetical protein